MCVVESLEVSNLEEWGGAIWAGAMAPREEHIDLD